MVKAKYRSGNVGELFNDKIDENWIKSASKILNIKQDDAVEINGFEYNKLEQLTFNVKGAYMKCRPDIDADKNSPSNKIKRLTPCINAITNIKKKILPFCVSRNNTPIEEMDESDLHILLRLQNKANRMLENPSKDAPVQCYADSEKYEFNKKTKELFELLDWFEGCFTSTKKLFGEEKSNKTSGKKKNKNIQGFFVELCNIYHCFTGEKPEAVYINNDNHTQDVRGKIIDFLELCFNVFEIDYSRRSLCDRLEKANSTDLSIPQRLIIDVRPNWL